MPALKIRDNGGIQITKDVRRMFPAAFNHTRGKATSEKFQLYPTDEIIEAFADKGLKLVEIMQQRSSKRSPLHTAHMLRFAADTAPMAFGLNDSIPEVVVRNAHDGRTSFSAWLGLFRFICENGMVVADQLLGHVNQRHYGQENTFERVMAVLADMPEAITKVSNRMLDWSALALTEAEQLELAQRFLDKRNAPAWLQKAPELALERHRDEDRPNTLWHTFNVLQENLTTRHIERPEGLTAGRQSPLRPLSGAMGILGYNQSIWTEAQAYYDAKVEGLTDQERAELRRQRDIWRLRARRVDQKRQAELVEA